MGKKQVVIPEGAPKAIGPYSVAIRCGEFLFVSGTLGMDSRTGDLVSGGIEGETKMALDNLSRVLESGGSSLDQVVKTTVFMQDLDDFGLMNSVYAEFFASDPPARSTVEVSALPKGALVEIEAIANIGPSYGD
jgi:2-iminobutanoate/2-iminopropanoate deaminase